MRGQQFSSPHPPRRRGPGSLSTVATGRGHSGLGTSSSLAPSNSGFAPRPLTSGRCLHGGAGLIITPLHPAFLATGAVISSAPVLGCSWWLSASTRLQPLPSPESHNLDPSLLTSQAQERLPWSPEVGPRSLIGPHSCRRGSERCGRAPLPDFWAFLSDGA